MDYIIALFEFSEPSQFAAQRREILAVASAARTQNEMISETEVSICGEILAFARTFLGGMT
jgi:hypothetical protein